MGWLWSSSSSEVATGGAQTPRTTADTAASASEAKRDFGLSDKQRTRIFGQPGAQASNESSLSNEADAEVDAFIKSFSAAESATTGSSTTEPTEQTKSAPPVYDRINPDGSINIHPSATYPRTMSCRQAFDQAFYCQSVGGKFNDLYRYGHVRDCSEQWGAFWFCMRTRTIPDKDKEGMIRDYYAGRDQRRRKECGSSEDVWDLREKAVEKAFWKDPDAEEEGHGVLMKE